MAKATTGTRGAGEAAASRIRICAALMLVGVVAMAGALASASELRTEESFRALCAHCGSVVTGPSAEAPPAGDACAPGEGMPSSSEAGQRVREALGAACTLTEPLRRGYVDRERIRRRIEVLWDIHRMRTPALGSASFSRDGEERLHLFVGPLIRTPVPGWALSLQTDLSFPLSLDAEAEEALLVALAEGSPELVVEFVLRGRESVGGRFCEISEGEVRVEVVLLSVAVLGASEEVPLVEVETRRRVADRVLRSSHLHEVAGRDSPWAWVSSLEVENEGRCARRDEALVSLALERIAGECYLRALREQEGLQGALVVRFQLLAEGRVGVPRVLIDALHSEPLRGCLIHALDGLELDRIPESEDVRMRATIHFQRGAPELFPD